MSEEFANLFVKTLSHYLQKGYEEYQLEKKGIEYLLITRPLFETLLVLTPEDTEDNKKLKNREAVTYHEGRIPLYLMKKFKAIKPPSHKVKPEEIHYTEAFNLAVNIIYQMLCDRKGIKNPYPDNSIWLKLS